ATYIFYILCIYIYYVIKSVYKYLLIYAIHGFYSDFLGSVYRFSVIGENNLSFSYFFSHHDWLCGFVIDRSKCSHMGIYSTLSFHSRYMYDFNFYFNKRLLFQSNDNLGWPKFR